jgi:uncharacterized protein YoxC
MKQVLIIENSTNKLQPIMESAKAADGTKDYVLGGIFTEFDVKNRNERIYTADKFLPHLQELNERINGNPGVVYGEFDHPDSFDISLGRISHVITKAEFMKEENLVRGEIKLLGTKYGKEAKAIIDDGFPIFVSSRAAGVTEANGVVNLKKLFTYDAVADPGFGSAKMEMKGSLNESLGFGSNANFRIFDLSNDTKTNELFEMNGNDMVTKDQLVEYSKYLTGELEKLQAKLESIATGKEGAPDFEKMQKMVAEYESMQMVQGKLVGYVNYLSDHLKHVLIENKSLKEQQGKIVEHTNYLADEISTNAKTVEMVAEHVYDNKELLESVNTDVKDLAEYSNYLSEHLGKTIEYAEYITENLVNTIEFTDYLSENLDASIAFSDYLAENVDANIDMSNYLAEHIETTIEYAEYITENVSDNIEYIDYIAENLDKNIGHAAYITEKLNKKFGTAKLINENVNNEEEESEEGAEGTEEMEESNVVGTEATAATNESEEAEGEEGSEEGAEEMEESVEGAEAANEDFEDEDEDEAGEAGMEAGSEEMGMEAGAEEDDDYFMSPDEFGAAMDAEAGEAEEGEGETISCTRDEEGNLVPAEGEEAGEAEEGEFGEEGEEGAEAGIEETPMGDETAAGEEETGEEMMDTDPMLSGIAAGKVVKIGGTVETAKVVSVSDEGVVVEMTNTGEQVLKQANEIVPLNDDGTESSLTDTVKNLIEEAKKREASKDEDPHFFTFLSEGQKNNFKELSQDDQERIKVAINESDGYFCQADVLKIMHKALEAETETLEERLVKNMPEDVKPIWEQLDAKSKNGVFAQARIHNLNTADLMEHFWRTRPQLKDNTNMLTEGKKTVDTDIIDNTELSDDVINMFKNKFENLK